MSVFSIAFSLFLIANPLGNSPAIIALIRDFPYDKQMRIMLRETIAALLIAFFFQVFGEIFLGLLSIKLFAISICGGVLMVLVSFRMIFPSKGKEVEVKSRREPVFVPIATPLISGPGLLTVIMLYSQTEPQFLKVTLGICLAWVGVGGILLLAPLLQKLLGKRGMIALEQLMGLTLFMMGIGLIEKGMINFATTL